MSERLTDEALDNGAGGSISTARFETVRYWLGHKTGDVFGPDCDYDGPTLTVEVADAADAQAMLEAINGDAFRRAFEIGWAERLKQEKNNSEVAAHRLRAENERLRTALADLVSWFNSGPSPYGPWIIVAGEQGADDAIEAAFAALSQPAPAPAPQPADDLRAAVPQTLSPAQLADACMSYRYDYGLMIGEERENVRREAAEWWGCFEKTLNNPPPQIRAALSKGGAA